MRGKKLARRFHVYEEKRKTERKKPVLYINGNASENVLKNMGAPPKAIHFSTRAFYLETHPKRLNEDDFVSSSGLILARANRGLKGILDDSGEDGILYSKEILNLNLAKTELASLSSCVLGESSINYSEGLYRLARAFKIAGVQSVLMPLRPVDDKLSKDFMVKFYEIWLASPKKITPAKALHKTRLYFIRSSEKKYQNPGMWSPYIIIDGQTRAIRKRKKMS